MKKSVLVLIVIGWMASSAAAQSLSAHGTMGFSNSNELDNPVGFGLFGSAPANKNIDYQLGYSYMTGSYDYVGSFPQFISLDTPTLATAEEPISTSTTVHAIDVNALYRIKQADNYTLRMGLGGSLLFFSGDLEGQQTGASLDFNSRHKFGINIVADYESGAIQNTPFRLLLRVKQRFLYGSTEETGTVDPFYESISISEANAGLSYHF